MLRRTATITFTVGLALGAATAPGLAAKGQDNGRHGVKTLAVSVSDGTLLEGEQATVTTTATKANGTTGAVDAQLVSSAPAVVRVDAGGLLTAVAPGTATITASAFRSTAAVEVVVTRAAATLAVKEIGGNRFGASSYALVGTGFTPGATVTATIQGGTPELRGFPVVADATGGFAGYNPSSTFGPQLVGPGFFTSGPDVYTGAPGTCSERLPRLITATDSTGRQASTTFVC